MISLLYVFVEKKNVDLERNHASKLRALANDELDNVIKLEKKWAEPSARIQISE